MLPRKEEFRHLLYFTVSRDKTIANHIMKCMVQGNTPDRTEMDLLVDVSFESQDLHVDTAALVRGGKSSITINTIYDSTHHSRLHVCIHWTCICRYGKFDILHTLISIII